MSKHKFVSLFVAMVAMFVLTFTVVTAYGAEIPAAGDDKVSTIEYFLFSDIIYENVDSYKDKRIDSFVNNNDFFSKKSKASYSNDTGKISSAAMMSKYIGNWAVDKCFINNSSGFYAAAFKNEEQKLIVISFRGTTDAIGKDGLNDAEFGLMTKNSPQMDDALKRTKSYIEKNNGTYTISTTGHSLGGGLAVEVAHYYDFNSQTFNAAQITSAIYYDNWLEYSDKYSGFDKWKHFDHINEDDFVVGTFEYGLLKKGIKHHNLNKANTFFAHAMPHMLTINNKNNSISLSKEVARNFLDKNTKLYSDIAENKTLLMGNSGDNILKSHRIFISNDVFFGGDGNDFIEARGGNDALIGGRGDDILDGGTDNDTYVYHQGDGNDTIIDPGGNDTLMLYTDDKVTYRQDGFYYVISLDGTDIIRIDITARIDGFCSEPYGGEENTSSDSFTVKVISSKGKTKKHNVKCNGKWHQIKKANITGNVTVDILDATDKVIATLDSNNTQVNLPSLSAYMAYDSGSDEHTAFIYSKDNGYYFHIRAIDKTDVLFLLDTQLIDKTHIKFSADKRKVKADTKFTLHRTEGDPVLFMNDEQVTLSKAEYMAASRIKLNRHFMVLEEGSSSAPLTVTVHPGKTSSKDVIWSTDDFTDVSISSNGIMKAESIGQSVITATVDGQSDSCKVYVLSRLYMQLIYAALILVIALLFVRISSKIKKRRRKRLLNEVQQAVKLSED